MVTAAVLTPAQAWDALRAVPDPELPAVSVCELGIVREVRTEARKVTVVVTPTYSGCPATAVIAASIRTALMQAGASHVEIETRLSPPWTTDWIAPAAAEKLREHGIAPAGAAGPDAARPLGFVPRIACPRCGSRRTERLSQFGSTACKALYRCVECREPFEHLKPI
jgi:ring-1,2-phenylacetyl-CoA epoxidase subunit PaaD